MPISTPGCSTWAAGCARIDSPTSRRTYPSAMSPLPLIPSRLEVIADGDGGSLNVRRWLGEPDLVSLLLMPTRPELTAGYELYGGALAAMGISVVQPVAFVEPGTASRDLVARLLGRLRADRPSGPVVLAGHGLGGLVAADYLESDLRQPDSAVLIGPTLAPLRKRTLLERLTRSRDPVAVVQERVAAGFGRIRVRTYIEHGDQDAVAPPSGWFALQRLSTSAVEPGDTVIFGGAGHDLPNDPRWQRRMEDLVGWLMRRAREAWPEAMPPAPDLDHWRRMTRAEAVRAFDAHVAGEGERLRRFRTELARRDGPDLAATREGMARLGAWLLEAVEAGPRDGDLPGWARSATIGPMRRLSADSLWLIDGTASHVAASLKALEPSLRWELCTDRIDANYHRTILAPIHLAPPVPATAIFRELVAEEPDGDWLARTWDAWIATLELVRADPHAMDFDPLPLDEVSVDPYDDGRWNGQVWIPEGAETVLGERRFTRLAGQIGRLKGVEDLAWEDREVMLVRLAPGVEPDDLRRRVVGVLRRARRAAEGEG